jgi:hypothetical protein
MGLDVTNQLAKRNSVNTFDLGERHCCPRESAGRHDNALRRLAADHNAQKLSKCLHADPVGPPLLALDDDSFAVAVQFDIDTAVAGSPANNFCDISLAPVRFGLLIPPWSASLPDRCPGIAAVPPKRLYRRAIPHLDNKHFLESGLIVRGTRQSLWAVGRSAYPCRTKGDDVAAPFQV